MKTIHYIFKNISWICLLSFVCCQASAQDDNKWLEEKWNASVNLRHVDYEEMFEKAAHKDKDISLLLRLLVLVEYCRAYGMDSLTVANADLIFKIADNKHLDKGVDEYLLDIKYKLALVHNNYDKIEQMACYVDNRWQDKQKLKDKAIHWHRLAAAGKDIQPVSIQRSKNVVSMAFERDSVGHVCIRADVNETKNQRLS